MTGELRYQRSLIDAVEEAGGWALKLSNRFTIGVPDLLIQLGPMYLVEVKMVDIPVRDTDRLKVALTPLQRQTLLACQKAGGNAGVLVCHKNDARDLIMTFRAVTPDTFPTKEEFLERCHTRKRGQELSPSMSKILALLLSPMR